MLLQARVKEVSFYLPAPLDDITMAMYPSAMVVVDEPRFTRVIANLVSNALKFTPQGGTVTVTPMVVEVGPADRPEGPKKYRLRISVKDSGAGISKENQELLFKNVVQFNSAKLQNGGGSGFGLWGT